MRNLLLSARALLALVASGVLTSGIVAASPLPDEPHVYVEGSAEIEVAPDQMTISVGLSHTHRQLAVAKEEVDARSHRLIKACRDLGIDPDDLATTALHVSPAYDYRGGEQVPLGTRVYRQVEITLRDLSKYSKLMAALVNSEISETIDTRLQVSNDKALGDEAMAAALEDARERATTMARALGRRLGEPYSISEFNTRRDERHQLVVARGVEARTSAAMPEMDLLRNGQSDEPFEPGKMVARAQVYVVFLLR